MAIKTAECNKINVTETGLIAQIRRLRGYHGWEGLKDELLRILWREAYSDDHARRIIDSIIDERKPNEQGFVQCPTPAELADFARNEPEEIEVVSKPRTDCLECRGTGWKHVMRGEYSCVQRCLCPPPAMKS